MKALLLTSLALISAITLASDRYVGDFPKVQFGNIFVPVDQICVDGDHVKTIYKIPVCVEWGGGDSSNCLKEVTKIVRTPIDYTKEIPRGENGFETINMTIPLTYKIQYGYYTEGGLTPVYTKKFTISDCE